MFEIGPCQAMVEPSASAMALPALSFNTSDGDLFDAEVDTSEGQIPGSQVLPPPAPHAAQRLPRFPQEETSGEAAVKSKKQAAPKKKIYMPPPNLCTPECDAEGCKTPRDHNMLSCPVCEKWVKEYGLKSKFCGLCTSEVKVAEKDAKSNGEAPEFKRLREQFPTEFRIFMLDWMAQKGQKLGKGVKRGMPLIDYVCTCLFQSAHHNVL